MSLLVTVFKILGSKWFALALILGMGMALPITWHNVTVLPVWWTILVFICNLGAVLMAGYKFFASFSKKKNTSVKEWN